MNGILLLLPVFLPLVLGLLSYFLPIRSESCRRLVYSLLILGTTVISLESKSRNASIVYSVPSIKSCII